MIEVWTDGLCEPVNPSGTACYGYIIKRNGKTINKDYGVIGTGPDMTNNVAEYTALIQALQKIKSLKLDKEKIIVRSDSRLVAVGMSQNWKIKAPRVLPLYTKAKILASGMDIAFQWIPREDNEEADELARLAYEH
jgi:ribonuclease HI